MKLKHYSLGIVLVAGGAASALAGMAPAADWRPEEALSGRRVVAALQAPAWRTFRWPDAVTWQPVLGAARWQGCPLDVVLFQSALSPLQLAQRWSALTAAAPGLLSEPDALSLHWYREGWHWLVQLTPTATGGTAGNVSALALSDCGAPMPSPPVRLTPGDMHLTWREPRTATRVQHTVRRIGHAAASSSAPVASYGPQRWQRDVVLAGEAWRIEHEATEER